MPGAGLAEDAEVLRHREVAGHPDLLAASDPHAVRPADHRLVAVEHGRDHVVEQAHVLPVLARVAGVDLCVLARVSTSAEGPVAGAGQHHRDGRAVVARRPQAQDDLLDHVGGVGVVLLGIVESDPDIVQTLGGSSGAIEDRTSLVEDLARGDRFD
jgi:hypothetical protein